MILSAIAAMSENRVIGVNNDLPWDVPEDLKYFKDTTRGKTIIMGRKTYESLGKALPKRRNIVLTRRADWKPEDAEVFSSLDEALRAVSETAGADEEVFIIGGGQIYAESLPKLDRIYLTVIHKSFDGDAYFPEFDTQKDWKIKSESFSSQQEPEPLQYNFFVFERK